MTDIPVEPKPENEQPKAETPVEDSKSSTLPGVQPQGLTLRESNANLIIVKLLESIQNAQIRQVKVLEAMATKQGIDVKAIR